MSSNSIRPGQPSQPLINHNRPAPTRAPASPRNPAPPKEGIWVKTPPLDLMLTTSQAAELLRISPETMKKWRQRHKGPNYVRFDGGVVRYPLSSILQYLQDHTVEP